jgi:hypothetical protein
MDISGLIGALIVLVLIGIGIAVGMVACVALWALVSVGMFSSSVLIGFWKRRVLAGVQIFFIECGVLLGASSGAVLAWGASRVWPMVSGEWRVLFVGAVGGAGGGLVIAWLASAAAAAFARHSWPWLRGKVTVLQHGGA